MAHIVNHGLVSNQTGTQIVNGNIIFNDARPGKRLRGQVDDESSSGFENNANFRYESDPYQSLDDDILASLAFPEMLHRRSDVESAHPRTCRWLLDLEEFRRWRGGTCGLLWIKGKPGSGKSTLMSYLHKSLLLERQVCDINLEFFFSARGVSLQHTFIGMLQSLLIQLFKQDDVVRQDLRALYIERRSSFGRASWKWTVSELKRLFKDMILSCSQRKQVILLVDALDESGKETAKEIATFLHTIIGSVTEFSGRAKICISCRHYPIPSSFKTLEIWLEKHNHDDIALYVKDSLSSTDVIIDVDQQNLDEIIVTLVEQADGVFQWVHLLIPTVIGWFSEGETTEQILRDIRQVPRTLEDVYENILTNIVDPKYRQMTLRLFQWVCLASRPLSIPELRYVLSADDLDTRNAPTTCGHVSDFEKSDSIMRQRILVWSGGLIEIKEMRGKCLGDPPSDRVLVIHQSVNDFMFATGLSLLLALNNISFDSDPKFLQTTSSLKPVQISHGILYRSCLKYLYVQVSCQVTSVKSAIGTHYPSFKDRIEKQYPLYIYAARYALTHAEKSGFCRVFDFEEESSLLKHSLPAWNLIPYNKINMSSISSTEYPNSGCTILHLASTTGSADLVKYRIECGDDIEEKDDHGWTAICVAVCHGRLAMVKLLFGFGANVNCKTHNKETPSVIAARRGQTETFRLLSNHGANISEGCQGSSSVLYAAVQAENIAISRLCLDADADINAEGGEYGTALQVAALNGAEAMINLLLEAGADINAKGGCYGTALQAAAMTRETSTVNLLLKAGADVNATGGRYGTALQAAASANYVPVLELLLKAGADVNAVGGIYGHALYAAAFGGDAAPVDLLIKAGADPNAEGPMGTTLQWALCHGHKAVVDLLSNAGARSCASDG